VAQHSHSIYQLNVLHHHQCQDEKQHSTLPSDLVLWMVIKEQNFL
jgi:hypothetical protein